MAAPLLVFSDLDGTLLDHREYDWSAAGPAVEALRAAGVPLVLASSKTRAEIEIWRRRLDNRDAFVSENGGALFVPVDRPPGTLPGAIARDGYRVVEFGTPYAELRRALTGIAAELGVGLTGFGDRSAAGIAEWTGLPAEDIEPARRREYDEPFVPDRPLDDDEEARLAGFADRRGLRVTRGGRFHHLLGASSKGAAARVLIEALAAEGGRPFSIALGDGDNDLELLAAVDDPVVVARPDGTHAPGLRAGLPGAEFTRAAGPAGFAEAILARLARQG